MNADFENGFADSPVGVAENVGLALETGVAGISIKDGTGGPTNPIYDVVTAVARLRAARAASTLLAAMCFCGSCRNNFLGRPDLPDTIARLKADAAAGADCLYAPGIRSREDIAGVVAAVASKL